jgi:hypothetical protein
VVTLVLVSLKANFCPDGDMWETWLYIQVSTLLIARVALHIRAMTKMVVDFIILCLSYKF